MFITNQLDEGDELDSSSLPDPLEVGEEIVYEVREGIVYDLDLANLLDEVAEDYGDGSSSYSQLDLFRSSGLFMEKCKNDLYSSGLFFLSNISS